MGEEQDIMQLFFAEIEELREMKLQQLRTAFELEQKLKNFIEKIKIRY